MTVDFDMDPFPHGYQFGIYNAQPTVFEEIFVSPILTIFRAYILPTEAMKYQGNAVCFDKNLFELSDNLPRIFSGLPLTIIICKSNTTFPEVYHDFKVRRKVFEMLLQYIIDNF